MTDLLNIHDACAYLYEQHNFPVKKRLTTNLWAMMRKRNLHPAKIPGKRGLHVTPEQLNSFAEQYEPGSPRQPHQEYGWNNNGNGNGRSKTTKQWNAICMRAETAVTARRAYILERCQTTGESAYQLATDIWQLYDGEQAAMEMEAK